MPACFDGSQTDLDLRAALVRVTNSLEVGEMEQHLVETLSAAGFLEDEQFHRMRDDRRREFAERPVRDPAHAGSAYPDDPEALRDTMAGYFAGDPPVRETDGAVRHRRAACQSGGRMAILSRCLPASCGPNTATALS